VVVDAVVEAVAVVVAWSITSPAMKVNSWRRRRKGRPDEKHGTPLTASMLLLKVRRAASGR
jgi:hypothetical protein